MTNVWENGQYSLAGSMSSNPIAYLTYKLANLLEATTGGIALPAISIYGNMVDLETTVADLMRVAAVSTGIFGSLGSMISGLGASFNGQAMLQKMGIEQGSGLTITPRGTGGTGQFELPQGGGNQTTSGSGYVGNSSDSDIKNSTMQEAEDSKESQMIEAKEEEEANKIDYINVNVLKIYELLDDVASGKRSLNVKVAGYGLTNLGSGTALSSAQGGVAGLLSNSPADNAAGLGTGNTASSSSGSISSSSDFGLGTGIDLGGWTMM